MARGGLIGGGILFFFIALIAYYSPMSVTLEGTTTNLTIPQMVAFCDSGLGQLAQLSAQVIQVCSEWNTLMLGIYGSGLLGIILIIVGAAVSGKKESEEELKERYEKGQLTKGEYESKKAEIEPEDDPKAIQILKERYAKGEITKEEFVEMKNDLEGHTPIQNYKPEKEEESEKETKQNVLPKKEEEKMSQSTWYIILIIIAVISIVLISIVVLGNYPVLPQQSESEKIAESQEQNTQSSKSILSKDSSGNARYFSGKVTGIIDGDTIQVDGESVRFALASTPEINTPMGLAAKKYVQEICPMGSTVTVDEDDGQTEGSYGRMVAKVTCNGVNLNQAVIEKGFGHLSFVYCDVSEFSDDAWSGCNSPQQQTSSKTTTQYSYTTSNCDPNYSGCVPISSYDLDCSDVGKNIKVTGSDPHGFDRDGDGIGCEG